MSSTQDDGPLYSAQQIVVPENLAFMLKLYTKAIIRAQPKDIYSFSKEYSFILFTHNKEYSTAHRYFAALEGKSKSEVEIGSQVNLEHLIKLHEQLSSQPKWSVEALGRICETVGISQSTLEAILTFGEFKAEVPSDEFIYLSTTIISQGLLSSIENTFKVCGKMLPTEEKVLRGSVLKKIFLFFTNKDSSLAARFVDEIANQLEANRDKDITYEGFKQLYTAKDRTDNWLHVVV